MVVYFHTVFSNGSRPKINRSMFLSVLVIWKDIRYNYPYYGNNRFLLIVNSWDGKNAHVTERNSSP